MGIESSPRNNTIESPENSSLHERKTPSFEEMSPEQQARVKKLEGIIKQARIDNPEGKGSEDTLDVSKGIQEKHIAFLSLKIKSGEIDADIAKVEYMNIVDFAVQQYPNSAATTVLLNLLGKTY